MEETAVHLKQLLLMLFLGGCFGVLLSRTGFCTMGAVSDWVNMGDKGRIGAWFGAIWLTMFGVMIFQQLGFLSLQDTVTPYLSPRFRWLQQMVGGFLFGIGMALASGCLSKNLVRFGGGSLKSLLVLIVAALAAFLITRGGLYELLFKPWLAVAEVDLGARGIVSQELPFIVSAQFGLGFDPFVNRLTILVLLAAFFVWFMRKEWSALARPQNLIASVVLALLVLTGWILTGGLYGQLWQEEVAFLDQIPVGVGAQSLTFTAPLIETADFIVDGFSWLKVSPAMVAALGVVLGSLFFSLLSGLFHLESIRLNSDLFRHLTGGVLMGAGGVLALGCSIGQGLTGISTLAAGSFVAVTSMIFGAALTMRVQFYRLVYESEVSLFSALITALCDFHFFPQKFRRFPRFND